MPAPHRPVGGQDEQRSPECEEREATNHEFDLWDQGAMRFSSKYHVRPPM